VFLRPALELVANMAKEPYESTEKPWITWAPPQHPLAFSLTHRKNHHPGFHAARRLEKISGQFRLTKLSCQTTYRPEYLIRFQVKIISKKMT
jgi:hypothetical protein